MVLGAKAIDNSYKVLQTRGKLIIIWENIMPFGSSVPFIDKFISLA